MMADLDGYLRELGRTLKVPARRRDEILEEVRSHLEEKIEELRQAGFTDEAAVAAALAGFGELRGLRKRFGEIREAGTELAAEGVPLFQASLTDGSHRHRTLTLLVSCGIHGVVLAILLMVPVVYHQRLSELPRYLPMNLPTWRVPLVAPRPELQGGAEKASPSGRPSLDDRVERATVPSAIPADLGAGDRPASLSEVLGDFGGSAGAGGWANLGNLAATGVPWGLPALPVPAKPRDPLPPAPRVHRSLDLSRILHRVEPAYPPLARVAGVQGTVVLRVVIGVHGQVADVEVRSGHPLLVPAAVEAVRQWRFTPTVLNGRPVEVVSTVLCVFRLNR